MAMEDWDFTKAESLVDQFFASDKGLSNKLTADAWFVKGFCLLMRNDAGADTAFKTALKTDPSHAESFNVLSAFLMDDKKYDLALALVEMGLEYSPEDPDLWQNKGMAEIFLLKYQDALNSLEKSLDYGVSTPSGSLSFEAMAYLQLGQPQKALDALDRALQLDPRDPTPNYYRGMVLEGMGNKQAAAASYQSFLDATKDWPAVDTQMQTYRTDCQQALAAVQ